VNAVPYTYEYPRPALSVDCVLFARGDQHTDVLLIRRKNEPYAGRWALPGGFVNTDETLEQAARRELEEETGVKLARLTQLGTWDAVERDPRERVITVAFVALVNAGEHAPEAADDAAEVRWFALDALPALAFDHAEIIAAAQERALT
jgi:8-oxo-dGTP diphosphatase